VILVVHKIGRKILDFLMYNSHGFELEWLRKKIFSVFNQDGGEQKNQSEFFFKMRRSVRVRFELDVEELLRLSLYGATFTGWK